MNSSYISILLLLAVAELYLASKLSDDQTEDHKHDAIIRNFEEKIAGGYPALPGQFSFFVHLLIKNNGTFICSGSLISNELVLTAAHCVAKYETVKLATTHIVFSEWESKGVKVYREKKVCVSPYYVESGALQYFDYAIIRLSEPVEFTESVWPIWLADGPIDPDTQAYSLGIGLTHKYGGKRVLATSLNVLPVKKVNCLSSDRHPTHICFEKNRPEFRGIVCSGKSFKLISTSSLKHRVN